MRSGGEVFKNRVGWARTYMKKAGLLDSTRRGYFKITDRGLNVLNENPPVINVKFLEQFEEFKEFRAIRKKKPSIKDYDEEQDQTPEEALESAYEKTFLNRLIGDRMTLIFAPLHSKQLI